MILPLLFIEANPAILNILKYSEAGKMSAPAMETLFIPSPWEGYNGLLTSDAKSIIL